MMTKKASNHNGVGIFNGYAYSASDEKYDIIAIKDDGHGLMDVRVWWQQVRGVEGHSNNDHGTASDTNSN
jgi:hypothetical protein